MLHFFLSREEDDEGRTHNAHGSIEELLPGTAKGYLD